MREIDALDAELKALFAGRKGEQFMVFHPSWGYFAEAYGLEQVPVEIEGKEPKPAQLQKLIRHARERAYQDGFCPAPILREKRRAAVPGDRRAGCSCGSPGGRLGRKPARGRPQIRERPRDERNMMPEPIIQMRDVWFSFNGQPVLREVNLTCAAGGFPGHHRPQRRRKNDPAQADARPARSRPGNGGRFRRAAAPGVAPHRLRPAERPYQQGLSRFPSSMSS